MCEGRILQFDKLLNFLISHGKDYVVDFFYYGPNRDATK